jgi:hypothetical protein
MKLEIECIHEDFTAVVDWPEIKPNELKYMVFISEQSASSELERLCLHHKATRPSIGKVEGMANGHNIYRFRKVGEKDYEKSRKITVSGYGAVITEY